MSEGVCSTLSALRHTSGLRFGMIYHFPRLPGTVGSPHGHLYLAHDARISSEGALDSGQGVSIW